jgi:hypothetical protein
MYFTFNIGNLTPLVHHILLLIFYLKDKKVMNLVEMSFLKNALVLTYHTTTIKTSTKLRYSIIYFNWIRLCFIECCENKGWEVQFNATPFKLLISDGI